jgi:hypothetical protein
MIVLVLAFLNKRNTQNYFLGDSVLSRLKENLSKDSTLIKIVHDKLIMAIDSPDFGVNSAIWTAGIINSGIMRFLSFDGLCMKINRVMDSEFNSLLSKIFGREKIDDSNGESEYIYVG